MTYGPLQKKILNEIVSCICQKYPKTFGIYQFGSFGSDFETPTSDIDIAILHEKPIDQVELWNYAQEIACIVRKDVDLIHLLSTSLVFQYQIITTGKLIMNLDPDRCSKYENLCYSKYLIFQEDRAPILNDLKNQGQKYG